MATKKDLTEAYAFSRRRLVTAFVSGAPGGREVEPARPGRTIVGGLALAVLLVAGAAVAGIFSPRVDPTWADEPGLIISKESGAAYVITAVEEGEEPVLRPVINITSAKLILGAEATPTIIPDEYIDQEQRGDDIGILGAPANVPGTDRLVDDGWTACTDPSMGLRLDVSARPEVEPVEGGGLLVQVEKDGDDAVYVIADAAGNDVQTPRASSYRVPASRGRDNLLGALGLPEAASASVVPEEWLALFPPGGDLTRAAFDLDSVGSPADYARSLPGLGDARVGDLVSTPSEQLLLTEEGPVTLTEFARAVYANSGRQPRVLELDTPPKLVRQDPPYDGAAWPTGSVTPVLGQLCAQLVAAAGERPGVRIVQNPTGDASAELVPLGHRSPMVDEGAGAYVLSGGWDQTVGGEPYLVDPKAQRYPLVGPDTAARLGYGDYAVPNVPDSWMELFREGVALSENQALCPPSLDEGEPCD